ncbi:MAG: hypothetical protein Q9160_001262 [Pyrenula sp. 1 TL-2023]
MKGIRQKHRPYSVGEESKSVKGSDPQTIEKDIFRHFFESTFEPLEQDKRPPRPEELELSYSETKETTSPSSSDWDGLSDADPQVNVEIVDHTESLEIRSMSDKSLARGDSFHSRENGNVVGEPEDKTEILNVKKDLALQRLLKESHLFDHKAGRISQESKRHQTTDIRLQSLGSKESTFAQERMPMSHRQGMHAKATAREAIRRKEAKDNGIVLERGPISKRQRGKKERAVGEPSVGRFSEATLVLSEKDVRTIEGGSRAPVSRKKGRR